MAFLTLCIVCIANNKTRNVNMYLNTRIFPTTGYARVLLFMFLLREIGGTGTGCLFQLTNCGLAQHIRASFELGKQLVCVPAQYLKFDLLSSKIILAKFFIRFKTKNLI